jgi:phenylalanyl-tRNA synthetase beta chain
VLAARGFLETVTWSFMSRDKAALVVGGNGLVDALTLDNPIASDLDYMRPTLIANLAEAAQRNLDHGARDVRLFEVGPSYPGDQPGDQRQMAAALVAGGDARHWSGPFTRYDAYAAKADVLAVLEALGQSADRLMVMEPIGPHWHPGRAATLRLGPKVVLATFGELHPAFLRALKVDGPLSAFEIDLGTLPAPRARSGKTRPLLDKADQTPVRRDFAFMVAEKVPAGDLVRFALKADPKLIADARVFDVYRGPGVPEGSKSVAIEITLQPRGAAMNDEEIEALARAVIASVTKGSGAQLRG